MTAWPASTLPLMIRTVLGSLPRDGRLLLLTRFIRLFAYGALSVVLVLYLTALNLNPAQVGLLLTLTLVGDTIVSSWLSTHADRIGRRRMLILGAGLMAAAGLVFAFTHNFLALLIAGTVGVISPSGNEVGPFLPIEQAALSQTVAGRIRTSAFAWYTLTGSMATALGSLFGGILPQILRKSTEIPSLSYRPVVFVYAAFGVSLALLFTRLSSAVEVKVGRERSNTPTSRNGLLGVGSSRNIVLRLSARFALDSFA